MAFGRMTFWQEGLVSQLDVFLVVFDNKQNSVVIKYLKKQNGLPWALFSMLVICQCPQYQFSGKYLVFYKLYIGYNLIKNGFCQCFIVRIKYIFLQCFIVSQSTVVYLVHINSSGTVNSVKYIEYFGISISQTGKLRFDEIINPRSREQTRTKSRVHLVLSLITLNAFFFIV